METGDPLLPARKVADSRSEMTELILPNDANTLGNLLGGRLMHYIDLVGAMAAYRHARSYVVTASMDHIDFIAPVHVGDLLILKSSLNRAFRTSMEVGVKVWVEHTINGTLRHVASAYLTFVAVDQQGGRVRVPPLAPETEEEQRRYHDAGRRREQGERERERKNNARRANNQSVKRGSRMAHTQTPPGPQTLPGVSNIIAVGSGKGGVGKTTLAVNLATAMAKMGFRVGLIDADIYGPNVPLMMGIGRQPRVLENNQIEPLVAHGVKLISVGFISPGDKPLVMRGPMLHQIIRQFLQQVQWGELDFLLVDLPPGTGDVVISLVQTVPLTGAVIISTPSDVSLQDARKALEMFHQVNVEVLGLVENMSHVHLPALPRGHRYFFPGRRGAPGQAKQSGVPGVD